MLPLFLFLILPLLEIATFVIVGSKIGLLNTLLLAFFMAIWGSLIVRYQGITTFLAANRELQNGGMPSREIFDGLLLILAAGLMIIPGFLTDFIAFFLLIPPVRTILYKILEKRALAPTDGLDIYFTELHEAKSQHRPDAPDIIDLPYKIIPPDDKP